MFDIQFLDHVAIRVQDMEGSAKWYQETLGLKRIQPREWGPFPIFMAAGQTGIALFPVRPDKPDHLRKGDHFAFRVDGDNFEKAKQHLTEKGIDWQFQDHHHYHSIYFQDPDGHQLELTTLVKEVAF